MLYRYSFGSFALSLSPKGARKLTLRIIKFLCHTPIVRLFFRYNKNYPSLSRSFFGLDLKSPVGIGAGLDLDVKYFNELNSIGAAFTTVGPLTLKGDETICGVRDAIIRLKGTDISDDRHVIAVLTKGHSTAQDDIADELDRSYTMIYDFADIVCIDLNNISVDVIDDVLDRITTIRRFNDDHRAILLKMPVNVTEADIDLIIHLGLSYGIDGIVIASGIKNHEVLTTVKEKSNNLLPIAVSGGISSVQSALDYIEEGASLLCISDELIKEGPLYIKRICKYLVKNENSGNLYNR